MFFLEVDFVGKFALDDGDSAFVLKGIADFVINLFEFFFV